MKTKTKIRLASVISRLIVFFRSLLGRGDHTIVIRNGVRWDLDLNEGIDFSIYLLGMFERSTVNTYKKLLLPGNTVLDIGANIGAHTLPIAHTIGPLGKIFAFEPTQYAYLKLVRNVSLNPALAERIHVEQMMLSDRDNPSPSHALYSSWKLTTTQVSRHPKHLGQLMDITGARTGRLDDFVAQLKLDRIDFIKIDVDGNECAVLRGAQRVLESFRPKILMEFMPYGLEESGHSLKELMELLKSAGYKILSVPKLAPLPEDSEELGKLIPDGSSINVLCLPGNSTA
jgi:FkbM family methyltransferase